MSQRSAYAEREGVIKRRTFAVQRRRAGNGLPVRYASFVIWKPYSVGETLLKLFASSAVVVALLFAVCGLVAAPGVAFAQQDIIGRIQVLPKFEKIAVGNIYTMYKVFDAEKPEKEIDKNTDIIQPYKIKNANVTCNFDFNGGIGFVEIYLNETKSLPWKNIARMLGLDPAKAVYDKKYSHSEFGGNIYRFKQYPNWLFNFDNGTKAFLYNLKPKPASLDLDKTLPDFTTPVLPEITPERFLGKTVEECESILGEAKYLNGVGMGKDRGLLARERYYKIAGFERIVITWRMESTDYYPPDLITMPIESQSHKIEYVIDKASAKTWQQALQKTGVNPSDYKCTLGKGGYQIKKPSEIGRAHV